MASRSALRSTDPKKVSGELFILTYGGLVSTLLKDYENVDDVNNYQTHNSIDTDTYGKPQFARLFNSHYHPKI